MHAHYQRFVNNCLFIFRPHPKVRDMDMLHASDYANMGMQQMEKKLNENKKKDLFVGPCNAVSLAPFGCVVMNLCTLLVEDDNLSFGFLFISGISKKSNRKLYEVNVC